MDNIQIIDKLRATFVFYATIVAVLSGYLIIQIIRGKAKARRGAIWLITAIWLQTFADIAEMYCRIGSPMTWRMSVYYIIYTILMVGLVKLSISSLPWKSDDDQKSIL